MRPLEVAGGALSFDIRLLKKKDRADEIARMIDGAEITGATRVAAGGRVERGG